MAIGMENHLINQLIYQLDEDDAQQVAMGSLGRYLIKNELTALKDKICEKIDWHEAIDSAISDITSSEAS